MRRVLLLALFLPAAAFGQAAPREAAEILADYARTLGDAAGVETLRARQAVAFGTAGARPATGVWMKDGRWFGVVHGPEGLRLQDELVDGDAAWLRRGGALHRFRPTQLSSRGGYYMYRGLTDLLPLREYLRRRELVADLEVAFANGFEVLVAPPDRHGVSARYLFDPKTHVLMGVHFAEGRENAFATVAYEAHKKVGGVLLPHRLFARTVYWTENEAERALVGKAIVRQVEVRKYEVNPALDGAPFELPGLGAGGGAGFAAMRFATGPDPQEVAAADLDGDGRLDFAVACEGGVWVHFGGDEKRPRRIVLGKGHHRGLAIADVDLDGRPDVLVTSHVSPAQMYFQLSFDADRKLAKRQFYGAPLFAWRLLSRDLDRDGIPDLVATGYGSRDLELKFGNGAGGFRPVATRWPLDAKREGRRGFGLDVADYNGDGMDDIAVVDGTRLVFFQGAPNLAFPPKVDFDLPHPTAVCFADIDADGLPDVVVSNEDPRAGADFPRDLAVLRNNGQGFQPLQQISGGAQVKGIATGDFDGDGHADIVTASYTTGEMFLLRGGANGTLSKASPYTSGRGACFPHVVDWNGDGRDDVLMANRLDDSVTVFLNTREKGGAGAARRVRPRVVEARMADVKFRMEGLRDPFEFVAEFALPVEIRDPSGLAAMGGDGVTRQLVLVSDKESAFFRATLDVARKRLVVGPPVPLRGFEGKRLDLEAVEFMGGNLFLGCEADGAVLRSTIFGEVLGRAATHLESEGNDGLEALTLRRLKDGTPLLYAFKERHGKTLQQPYVAVFGVDEDPFAFVPRRGLESQQLKLPVQVVDQSGAAVFDGRLYVVHRMARSIVEVSFDGNAAGFDAKSVKEASFLPLVANELGLKYDEPPFYGMVEGIAFDATGDLFLLLDNNGKTIGREGKNRGAGGRLLWFRNRGMRGRRAVPDEVTVRHVLVPWKDAQGAPKTELTRAEAEKMAREVLQRAEGGEAFARLVEGFHYTGSPFRGEFRVTREGVPARLGAFRPKQLPAALYRLAFALDVGEVGLCEWHLQESPYGFHVLKRVK